MERETFRKYPPVRFLLTLKSGAQRGAQAPITDNAWIIQRWMEQLPVATSDSLRFFPPIDIILSIDDVTSRFGTAKGTIGTFGRMSLGRDRPFSIDSSRDRVVEWRSVLVIATERKARRMESRLEVSRRGEGGEYTRRVRDNACHLIHVK